MSARKPALGQIVRHGDPDQDKDKARAAGGPVSVSWDIKIDADQIRSIIFDAAKEAMRELAGTLLPNAPTAAPKGPFIRLKQYEGHYVFLQKPKAGVDSRSYNGSANGEYVVIEQTPHSLRCIRPWLPSSEYSEGSVILQLQGWDRVELVEDVEDWAELRRLRELYQAAVPTAKGDSESDYGFKAHVDRYQKVADRLKDILDAHDAGVTPVTYPMSGPHEESPNAPFQP